MLNILYWQYQMLSVQEEQPIHVVSAFNTLLTNFIMKSFQVDSIALDFKKQLKSFPYHSIVNYIEKNHDLFKARTTEENYRNIEHRFPDDKAFINFLANHTEKLDAKLREHYYTQSKIIENLKTLTERVHKKIVHDDSEYVLIYELMSKNITDLRLGRKWNDIGHGTDGYMYLENPFIWPSINKFSGYVWGNNEIKLSNWPIAVRNIKEKIRIPNGFNDTYFRKFEYNLINSTYMFASFVMLRNLDEAVKYLPKIIFYIKKLQYLDDVKTRMIVDLSKYLTMDVFRDI